MARVGAITRATGEDQKKLAAQAKNLGSTTSFSASEAAAGTKFLGMTGFNTSEIIAAMPSTLHLARASVLDLGTVADIGSNILSGFGLKAEEMTRVTDVLVASATRSNVKVRGMGEALKYVAPIAKGLGIPLEDAAAAAGLLGNVGIKGSMAGTTRAAMQRLAAPTGAAADELATLGVMVKDETGNLRPFVTILEDLAVATEGLGTADRTEILKKLFDVEAAAGVAELLNQAGTGKLRQFAGELGNVSGEAKRISDALDNIWRVAKKLTQESVKLTLFAMHKLFHSFLLSPKRFPVSLARRAFFILISVLGSPRDHTNALTPIAIPLLSSYLLHIE